MSSRFALPTLLSQALVAFTIEFDNEAERGLPHSTTRHGSTAGALHTPWLVSMAMYLNCMQFVDEKGITARELVRRARTKTNFRGMYRWGYISVRPDPEDQRPKPPKADWIVSTKPGGREAQKIWRPLLATIEQRWQQRFGADAIEELKKSLATVEGHIELDLPDCLPILGYGLMTKHKGYRERSGKSGDSSKDRAEGSTELSLAVLLARVLLAFALEFENESELSLAMSSNVVRVLASDTALVRDLPRLTGVSKEGAAMSLSFLTSQGYAVVVRDPAGARAKVARLTAKGFDAYDRYEKRLRMIEKSWRARYGDSVIRALRQSLQQIVGDGTTGSPLFEGLEPAPNGWRSNLRRPETLPHYPMVLHRGGFPDGS
jgi:DNA-binding MarR family transcriptional regulator